MVIDGLNKKFPGFGTGWGGQGMSHTLDVSGCLGLKMSSD